MRKGIWYSNPMILVLLAIISSCTLSSPRAENGPQRIMVGAERLDTILSIVQNKRVAVATNHSGLVGETHLVDTLLEHGVQVIKIFSPEHGFRGDNEAGETILNHTDAKTGLKIISLYGEKKRPTNEDLSNVELVLFDMQDVGLRFYTYISTMHYVMEACAENSIPLVVLDRPNPNGFFVDGPMLEPSFQSFVGMHPVPVVHGMTIGEYALMINGERWLKDGLQTELHIVPCTNYTHDSIYTPPLPPSPNLPNLTSILLYPSLGFFEGTQISIGRGTNFPFQVYGHSKLPKTQFEFTPESRPGASKNPPQKGEKCYGIDLRDFSVEYFRSLHQINLDWLLHAYSLYPHKDKFFNAYFNTLAGSDQLKKQIVSGMSADSIRASWAPDIKKFMHVRQKYLLYPDFETAQ